MIQQYIIKSNMDIAKENLLRLVKKHFSSVNIVEHDIKIIAGYLLATIESFARRLTPLIGDDCLIKKEYLQQILDELFDESHRNHLNECAQIYEIGYEKTSEIETFIIPGSCGIVFNNQLIDLVQYTIKRHVRFSKRARIYFIAILEEFAIEQVKIKIN